MNQFLQEPQSESNLNPSPAGMVQNSEENLEFNDRLAHTNNVDLNSESESLSQQASTSTTLLMGRNHRVSQTHSLGSRWGLSTKLLLGAIALSAAPLLILASILYWNPGPNRSASTITPESVQQERQNLGLGVGLGGLVMGAIAALLTQRTAKPVLRAASTSNNLVNRLRQEAIALRDRVEGKDELIGLETNLQLLSQQLPTLLSNETVETEKLKVLMDITQLMREARSGEDLLRMAVGEVRQRFRTERVTIFQINENGEGVFIEESVAQGWSKLLWSTVDDPCFTEGYLTQYQEGRVRAIDNIYEANLGDCHVGMLERFRVKANLVAPIIQNAQVFGLLIAHQCSAPRFWQSAEIDLFAQIATQIGFALDRVRLLEEIDERATQAQRFIEIARRIRTSLNTEDVLQSTVNEMRKAINADRVIVYSFDEQWYGTVVAEAVLPGYPKALWAKIKDPCFEEGYVDQYLKGRVQATPNVELAGLTLCHLKQLEPFAVKANLVAPILKEEKLFGLLIAHQCSGPRDWKPTEVDLFAQIAIQVGFALDHARLLDQVDQAYQGAESASQDHRYLHETLRQGVSDWLNQSEPVVKALSEGTLKQMESITTLYQHLKTYSTETQLIATALLQQETQGQQAQHVLENSQHFTDRLQEHSSLSSTKMATASQQVQSLSKPAQKLAEITQLTYQITSQMKLQAMNAVLEATRIDDSTPAFAGIGEKVLDLARQLEGNTVDLSTVAQTIQTQLFEIVDSLQTETQHIQAGTQLGKETHEALAQVVAVNTQLQTGMQSLVQSVHRQSESSATVNQIILEVAAHANQVCEQAIAIANTLEQLNVLSHRETPAA